MSYQNLEKALQLAPKCINYETDDGISDEHIRKSEELLGIRFSKQAQYFYKNYNYMSFYGYEIDGIDPNSSFPLGGNAVASALADRKKYGLPEKWIPLCFLDDGYYAYMDYSQLNAEGEPRIIEAVYTNGEHLDEFDDDLDEENLPEGFCRYEITQVLGEDLGEYLLGLVEETLSSQNEETLQCKSASQQDPDDYSNYTLEDIKAELAECSKDLERIRREIEEEFKGSAQISSQGLPSEEPAKPKKSGFRFPFFGKRDK